MRGIFGKRLKSEKLKVKKWSADAVGNMQCLRFYNCFNEYFRAD